MERTCLVTKIKADPNDLLRFTVIEDFLVFDGIKKASGRGGYVIRTPEALVKLAKLGGKLAYFLKVKKVEVTDEEIERGKSLIIN